MSLFIRFPPDSMCSSPRGRSDCVAESSCRMPDLAAGSARGDAEPEAVQQPLATSSRAAECESRSLRPSEVEVSGVLPGEPDAAVGLDGLGHHQLERL